MKILPIMIGIVVLLILFVLGGALYTVHETETVILTQFGRPVGEPVTEPGLHFKTPFVQEVNRLEKRILEWDGDPTGMLRGWATLIHGVLTSYGYLHD